MHAQGTSRGGADIKEIVKRIDMWAIDMVRHFARQRTPAIPCQAVHKGPRHPGCWVKHHAVDRKSPDLQPVGSVEHGQEWRSWPHNAGVKAQC